MCFLYLNHFDNVSLPQIKSKLPHPFTNWLQTYCFNLFLTIVVPHSNTYVYMNTHTHNLPPKKPLIFFYPVIILYIIIIFQALFDFQAILTIITTPPVVSYFMHTPVITALQICKREAIKCCV